MSKHKPQVPGDHRTLAISHEKGRRNFLQRTSPPAWAEKVVQCHFDVSGILETWKCLNELVKYFGVDRLAFSLSSRIPKMWKFRQESRSRSCHKVILMF